MAAQSSLVVLSLLAALLVPEAVVLGVDAPPKPAAKSLLKKQHTSSLSSSKSDHETAAQSGHKIGKRMVGDNLENLVCAGTDPVLTASDRQAILEGHNQLRRAIAHGHGINQCGNLTGGANIYSIKWNCDYERDAQSVVDSCDLDGFPSDSVNKGRGMNLALVSQFGSNVDVIVSSLNQWWSTVYSTGQKNAQNRLVDGDLAPWAQMAHGPVSQIGCSISSGQCDADGGRLFFCYYDQLGSDRYQVVYEKGQPCRVNDDCSQHLKSVCEKQTGLCVAPEEDPDTNSNEQCSTQDYMSDAARQRVLKWHNALRSRLQRGLEAANPNGNDWPQGRSPPGTNIRKLRYSCALEESAYNWAANCNYSHSPQDERPGYGENLFQSKSGLMYDKADLIEHASKTWWSELAEIGIDNAGNVLQNNGHWKNVGHYSQMAWAETAEIGCAVVACPGVGAASSVDDKFGFVVCQYSPAGNQLSGVIYKLASTPSDIAVDCKDGVDGETKLCN